LLALVAGACGAVATGSVGTTTGAGAEADDADGVTLVAAAGDDGGADGASMAGDVVADDDGAAGDAAGSERALFRDAAVFALAIGACDLVAAVFAGADERAGAGASAAGSERVSTPASDGCVPTGELMAGNDGRAAGAGVLSARGAVTGVAGAALPPSERDGPKNTYASTARTATTSALARTSAVVDGPVDPSSGTKPRTR